MPFPAYTPSAHMAQDEVERDTVTSSEDERDTVTSSEDELDLLGAIKREKLERTQRLSPI
jgi:hypothetical protein